MEERDFKGIWLPKEVWLDDRLTALEKVIYAEIDSLDRTEEGCFASNETLANFCQCSEWKVSSAISKLIDCGYIYVKSFDGRKRYLKSRLGKIQSLAFEKAKAASGKSQDNKIDNKINNNISINPFASDAMNETFNLWLQYKKEKNQTYKETGRNQLISKLKEDIEKYGETVVIKWIKESMKNNWAGIYIHEEPKKQPASDPPSYDIDAFEKKMNTTVPKLRKKV